MDPQTLSAYAAAAAALAAATVAAIQLFVGYRQSKAALLTAEAAMLNAKNAGRHRIASFRQTWIDVVRDALCEYHSILMNIEAGEEPAADDERKLSSLKTRLDLLLNP